jgi:hypothetical protein
MDAELSVMLSEGKNGDLRDDHYLHEVSKKSGIKIPLFLLVS